jgi:peroxiredoxin
MIKIDRRTLLINLAWLIAFLVVFFGVRAYQQRDMVKGTAPALSGKTLTGEDVALSGTGEPLLIHFWASWCRICKFEQDSIVAINKNHHVITVAMQSGDDAAVARHVEEQKLDFPVINDVNGELSRQFGVRVVPTTFVVDSEGNIRFVEVGFTSELGLRARLWLAGMN